jgi:hypothetical protein
VRARGHPFHCTGGAGKIRRGSPPPA